MLVGGLDAQKPVQSCGVQDFIVGFELSSQVPHWTVDKTQVQILH